MIANGGQPWVVPKLWECSPFSEGLLWFKSVSTRWLKTSWSMMRGFWLTRETSSIASKQSKNATFLFSAVSIMSILSFKSSLGLKLSALAITGITFTRFWNDWSMVKSEAFVWWPLPKKYSIRCTRLSSILFNRLVLFCFDALSSFLM